MSNWQKVYSDRSNHRANIVLAVLNDFGLQPVILDKKDTSYQLGYYEVHVAADEVIRAIKIIKDDIKFDE